MSKFLLHGWAILLLTFGMSACSLVPNELNTAEQLIETAPDSALHILQHLAPDKYKSDKNRALYGLLVIEALDSKKCPLKPDSLLDFSINYYIVHPTNDRLATCYLFKGRTLKYSFQYEKAMNYYLKALDEAKDSKDNILLGRINFDLGDIYIIQSDYSLAREKYKIAYFYFNKANFLPQAFYSLLNIGRTYYEIKDYKKAEIYYRRILIQTKDSIQQAALYQAMGLNFCDSKKLDSALIYFRQIIHYPYIGNNRAIRYNLLANLFFVLNNVDSAQYYALNAFKYDPPIRTQRECYRMKLFKVVLVK